jgi:hypothetical protein
MKSKVVLLIMGLVLIGGCKKPIVKTDYFGNGKVRTSVEVLEVEPGKFSKNGDFVLNYKSGRKKLEGTFKRDTLDGHWTAWYENGKKLAEGEFEHGLTNGRFIFYDSSGVETGSGNFHHGTGSIVNHLVLTGPSKNPSAGLLTQNIYFASHHVDGMCVADTMIVDSKTSLGTNRETLTKMLQGMTTMETPMMRDLVSGSGY